MNYHLTPINHALAIAYGRIRQFPIVVGPGMLRYFKTGEYPRNPKQFTLYMFKEETTPVQNNLVSGTILA